MLRAAEHRLKGDPRCTVIFRRKLLFSDADSLRSSGTTKDGLSQCGWVGLDQGLIRNYLKVTSTIPY
jgi:hypothetical protein